jgi:fermentation-respiration switch protein FrsA (DUF1100 family)
MNKDQILSEIRRTASAGTALGWRRFEAETGIRYYDWYGTFWTRWSDAVREAGLEPSQMSEAYDEVYLLRTLADLTRSLGHVPTQGDMLIAGKNVPGFPSEKVFRKLGSKPQRALRVVSFCESNPGYDAVADMWRQVPQAEIVDDIDSTPGALGYVYLLKHGARREYKIGRTNNPLRREGEIGIDLPEKLQPVHYIETDDPSGVEAYWHTRFAAKRKEGEWFGLTQQDVSAFKRWRKI